MLRNLIPLSKVKQKDSSHPMEALAQFLNGLELVCHMDYILLLCTKNHLFILDLYFFSPLRHNMKTKYIHIKWLRVPTLYVQFLSGSSVMLSISNGTGIF